MRQRLQLQAPAQNVGEAQGNSGPHTSAEESAVEGSAESVLGVGLRGRSGGGQGSGSADQRASDEEAPAGSVEGQEAGEASQAEVSDGKPLRKRKLIRKSDIVQALKICEGDIPAAAKVLGCQPFELRAKINKDKQLVSQYSPDSSVEPPTLVDVMARKSIPEAIDAGVGEATLKMNAMLTSGVLEKLVKKETLELLNGAPSVFGGDAGKYLTGTLDLHHQMMVVSNVQVFERSQEILENLRNNVYDEEVAHEWQKTYNQLVELLQKGYDRSWQGTLSAAKLLNQRAPKDGEKKATPAFTPLKR